MQQGCSTHGPGDLGDSGPAGPTGLGNMTCLLFMTQPHNSVPTRKPQPSVPGGSVLCVQPC